MPFRVRRGPRRRARFSIRLEVSTTMILCNTPCKIRTRSVGKSVKQKLCSLTDCKLIPELLIRIHRLHDGDSLDLCRYEEARPQSGSQILPVAIWCSRLRPDQPQNYRCIAH